MGGLRQHTKYRRSRWIGGAERGENVSETPEVWLRGPIEGFEPLLMPAVHALLQVREDLATLVETVPAEHVWRRAGRAASIGFHVRHLGGALDRLLTYARGESLSIAQRTFLQQEGAAGDPPATLRQIVADADDTIARALEQLRTTDVTTLGETRRVGRAGLPATVLGLLFHAAEHSTRHMGQAITTGRVLSDA
jgi:uncharacterized damage-inducible protein DinB